MNYVATLFLFSIIIPAQRSSTGQKKSAKDTFNSSSALAHHSLLCVHRASTQGPGQEEQAVPKWPRDSRGYSRRQRCRSVWCSVRSSASWWAARGSVGSTRRCSYTARGAQLAPGPQPAQKKKEKLVYPLYARLKRGMGKTTFTAYKSNYSSHQRYYYWFFFSSVPVSRKNRR